jgi:hypothetical protein
VLDEVVELELVDFAGVELSEAKADVLEEYSELFLVVHSDRIACGAAFAFSSCCTRASSAPAVWSTLLRRRFGRDGAPEPVIHV